MVGDLTEAADRKRALEGAALVVNVAATFRSPAVTEADRFAVNRDAAVALARESAQAGVRRFVHTSTNNVYGPGRGRPAREDDELRAAGTGRFSAYSVSKRECEERLRGLSGEVGLDIVTLCLPFVYGEGDSHIKDILPRYMDLAEAGGRSVEDPWSGVPDTTRAYRELGSRPIYPSAKAAWRDGAL